MTPARLDIPKSLLEQLYYDEGLPVEQVARRLGCSEATIKRRMRDYGMMRRSPGEYRLLEIPKELLVQLYYEEGLTQAEIAERLQCDPVTIWRRMREYGMSQPRTAHNLSREFLERLYWGEGFTVYDIAEKIGCGVSVVCRRLAAYGIETRAPGPIPAGAVPNSVTWAWTAEFAYAIGLIAADGNLPKRNRNDVVFVSTDRELHEAYQRCLGVCVPMKERPRAQSGKTSYVTTITSLKLRQMLEGIGLAPAKSKSLGPLDVPDEFFRDFLRGCWDGDGSVVILKPDDHRRYLAARLFSGSEEFITWIYNTIKRLTEIEGRLYRNQQGVWRLDCAYRKGEILLDWLYYEPGLPCLNRKRAKYEEYIRWERGLKPSL